MGPMKIKSYERKLDRAGSAVLDIGGKGGEFGRGAEEGFARLAQLGDAGNAVK